MLTISEREHPGHEISAREREILVLVAGLYGLALLALHGAVFLALRTEAGEIAGIRLRQASGIGHRGGVRQKGTQHAL